MNLKRFIRFIKTYKIFEVFLFLIDMLLLFVDLVSSKKPKNPKEKSLLIIKTNFIGDYFFFRNFIEVLRKNEKYLDYKITIIGNKLWKSIFDEFDSQYVDNSIWIDIYRFSTNIKYRSSIIKEVTQNQYELAINPVFTRILVVDDYLMRAVHSKEKIGQKAADYNIKPWEMWIGDRFYTKLIDGHSYLFDFDYNKHFVEQILNVNLAQIKTMTLKIKENPFENKYKKPYVVMVPGAGDIYRQWSPDNFAIIANYLLKNTNLNIYISGSKAENTIAQKIIQKCQSDKVYNLTNNLPLPELLYLLNDAELLISNDSSAIPMSVSLGLKTICLANGMHFGRFTPYPDGMAPNLVTFYPPEMRKHLNDFNYLVKLNKITSKFDINEIEPDEIIDAVNKTIPSSFQPIA